MLRQPKKATEASGEGTLWLFGVILLVQGFGSAVTEVGWNTSFGVAGLLRAAHVPWWGALMVGALGCALLVLAGRRRLARKRGGRHSS
ncbi:hypothetical protein ACIA78_38475 [Streptomyces xanthochromogenes]|uniref:hypothetical protein n=1 Tax=Streptomyces TaxID=1883 RepID=UPI000765E9DA|nr:hypothetical protein [Streptomyces europaeiscabiei]MDX3697463.1 hypothetical protein [Streptomyces europaeiscabiei]